jgi:uncharacterized protein
MSLKDIIQKDLTDAIKGKDEATKSALRFVLGEFSRGVSKDISDAQIIKILKKSIENEKEVSSEDSPFIKVLSKYLPKEATKEEIKSWISENIDFSKYKNKMQSMKDIMSEFSGRVDGNVVKDILSQI